MEDKGLIIRLRTIFKTGSERNPEVMNRRRGKGNFGLKKKRKASPAPEEAGDHVAELEALAEWGNREARARGSHYRFHIRSVGDDLFVDVVILDERERVKEIMASEITHEELLRTVEHIREGEGVLFDRRG